MDLTTKRLMQKLREARLRKQEAEGEIFAIEKALELGGVRVSGEKQFIREMAYEETKPFQTMPLSESCVFILEDHKHDWLTKSQVEYLLVRGGYKSSAKDAKNSVDVTLRRLANDGKLEAERVRGAKGNRYRYPMRFPREKKESEK